MKQPIIIRNNLIPCKGYAAINLFGVLFVRNDANIDGYLINHELIHTVQMRELLYVGFYIVYLLFWLALLPRHRFNIHSAYMHISFEKEAYSNQYDKGYLQRRKPFEWTNYMKNHSHKS